jgi:hypothetical protein
MRAQRVDDLKELLADKDREIERNIVEKKRLQNLETPRTSVRAKKEPKQ